MKKIISAAALIATLSMAGAAFAQTTPATDTSSPVLPTIDATKPQDQTIVGAGKPYGRNQIFDKRVAPPMRGAVGMMNTGGQYHIGAFGALHMVAGLITMLLIWAILVLLVILLYQRVKKNSQK